MPTPSSSSPEKLSQLLNVTEFSPPADFASRAQVTDPGIDKRAASDTPAWWAEQARQRLDWQPPSAWSSTTAIPPSTPGSPTARSMPPITAWTGT